MSHSRVVKAQLGTVQRGTGQMGLERKRYTLHFFDSHVMLNASSQILWTFFK